MINAILCDHLVEVFASKRDLIERVEVEESPRDIPGQMGAVEARRAEEAPLMGTVQKLDHTLGHLEIRQEICSRVRKGAPVEVAIPVGNLFAASEVEEAVERAVLWKGLGVEGMKLAPETEIGR